MKELKINNSKDAAVKDGKWKNPGAKLYDTLLDAFYYEGEIPKDSIKLNKMIKEGKVLQWNDYLKEAYLIAPITHIKNSPYGRTPYSNSGCKYPHHVIKGNELVLSRKGVIAAYSRAKQMGIYKGDVKEHLERHMKELGIDNNDKNIYESIMHNNFNDIYDYLNENLDINLYEESADKSVLDKNFVKKDSSDINSITLDIHDTEAIKYIKKDNYLKDQDLNKYNGEIIIDSIKDAIIGRFLIGTGDDEGFISSFRVYDNYKGYGFGNKLIEDAIKKYNGYDLCVRKDNKIAINLYKKHGFEILENMTNNDTYYMKLKNVLSEDELIKVLNEASSVFEYLNNLNTPKEIFEWIKTNISYDKALADWKLKTPLETCTLKKGNCHDQSLLSYTLFSKLNIPTGQIFFIEYKEGETIGGNTHTFTWYINDEKYYWFETAWEDQAGIHGPFKSIDDMKYYVRKVWNNDNDINSRKYNGTTYWDDIDFSEIHQYKTGMSLAEYVSSWVFEESINESLDWIDKFVHDEKFRESVFSEASHGKLKYDFRLGWDYNTGHQIKVVYSLDDINISDIGNFYYNYDGKKVGATHDSHLDYVRKNIVKKGNTDHQSHGQKVLAIVDMVTNQKLNSVTLLNPFCKWIDTHKKIQDQDNLIKARNYADTIGSKCKTNLVVGKIDDSKSFKSTHWATKVTDPKTNEDLRFNKIAKSEMLKDGKGWKVNNIDARDLPIFGDDGKYLRYHNPNKKQALNELIMREKDVLNYLRLLKNNQDLNNPKWKNAYDAEINNLRIIQNDINTIEKNKYDLSIMKKYRDYDEAAMVGLNNNQTLNFNTYMDYRISSNSIEKDISEIPFNESINRSINEMFNEEFSFLEEAPNTSEEKPESLPKQTDKAESDKNGIRRKKLYIAFIEWAKTINEKNMFGSIFDKDAFKITYPFIPEEMRYFYRLANPILCVLSGNLTFFQVSELKHLNIKNSKMNEMLIFAATETDFRVFNNKDKKVYRAIDKDGALTLMEPLGNTFDIYIQNMIKKGDILNGPITESFEEMNDLDVARLYEENKRERFKNQHENMYGY